MKGYPVFSFCIFAFFITFSCLSAEHRPTMDDIKLSSEVQCDLSKKAASKISASLNSCINPRKLDETILKDSKRISQLCEEEGSDALILFRCFPAVPQTMFDYSITFRPQKKEDGNFNGYYKITVNKIGADKKDECCFCPFVPDPDAGQRCGFSFALDENGDGDYFIEFSSCSAEETANIKKANPDRYAHYDYIVKYRIEHRYGVGSCLEVESGEIGIDKKHGGSMGRYHNTYGSMLCYVFGKDGKEIGHCDINFHKIPDIEKKSETFAKWFHDLNFVKNLNIKTISVGSFY